MQTINIGHNSCAVSDKVILVLSYNSAPVKNLKKLAKEENRFIDATFGKPTRSLLIMSEGLVVASSVMSDTMKDRLNEQCHPTII